MLSNKKQFYILVLFNLVNISALFISIYLITNTLNSLSLRLLTLEKSQKNLDTNLSLLDSNINSTLEESLSTSSIEILTNQNSLVWGLGITLCTSIIILFYLNAAHLETLKGLTDQVIHENSTNHLFMDKLNTEKLIKTGSEGLTQLNTFSKSNLMEMETRIIDTLNTKIQSHASNVVDAGVNTVLENPTLVSGAVEVLNNLGSTPPSVI